MKRRRRLSDEERALWARVIEQAVPLHDPGLPQDNVPPPPDPARPSPPRNAPQMQPALPVRPEPPRGSVTLDLAPSLSERLAAQRVDMDRRKFGRMRRGKLGPEARLDLHGLTQAEAHAELIAFILLSQQIGRRLVLVITGKGSPGVLRTNVPHWLSLPPLRPVVLQIAEAHQSHGGAGAIYVYLRKLR